MTKESAQKTIETPNIQKQLKLHHGDRIGKEIGAGSFSTVFSVVDKNGKERDIVLKFGSYAGKLYEVGAIKEVLDDLEEGAYDDDLHIVKPIAFAVDEYNKYIIQMRKEHVVSKSDPAIRGLFSQKDETKNDIAALRLTLEIVVALKFFHDRGYVHRDVKPNNLFYRYRADGEITFLLGDFNTCRKKEEPDAQTATVVFTAGFCPTIWCAEINPCRDIYALGATLYFLLSEGADKNVLEYLKRLASGKSGFVSPPRGTPELHKIIERAMTPDEGLNYPNIESLKQELLFLYQKRKSERDGALRKAEEEKRRAEKATEEIERLATEKMAANESLKRTYEEKWIREKISKSNIKRKRKKKVKIVGIVAAAILLTALFFIIPDSQAVQLCIGNHYYEQADYEKAVEWYQKSAIQGNADAQNKLGDCYQYGYGVEYDPEEAVAWYRKSAEQGNALGQNNLAYCYQYGYGVEQDLEQAVAWYRKFAEQGNAYAQNSLGDCYQLGFGVEQDPEEAVAWYRKSAEQGNAFGQNSLGECYCCGIGVEKDPEQAVAWYRKSAEQGNADAQSNLGNCYRDGIGVERDMEQAVAWYRKSAKQGNFDGCLNLSNAESMGWS